MNAANPSSLSMASNTQKGWNVLGQGGASLPALGCFDGSKSSCFSPGGRLAHTVYSSMKVKRDSVTVGSCFNLKLWLTLQTALAFSLIVLTLRETHLTLGSLRNSLDIGCCV